MSKTKQVMGILLVLGIVLFVACAPKASPAPVPQAPAPAPAATPAPSSPKPVTAAVPAKPAWQEEWDRTLAAARKEGKVVIHTSGSTLMRSAMVTGFKDAYGISAEVISGRTSELLPRLFAERRAGLYTIDINVGGYNSILIQAKPAGLLDPLDSVPILPEVTDPKNWYQGKFPWVDKDHTVIRVSLHPNVPMAVNTNLVKPDEIKS